MNVWDQLGQLGGSVVGTLDDLVDAYGDNAVNRSDADAVRIRNAQSQILINEAQAQADIRAKENMTKLLNIVAYVVLLLIAALVVSSIFKQQAGK